MRSMSCSRSNATTCLSYASRSTPFESMAPQGRPSAFAVASPGALGRFEQTNPIWQSNFPSRTFLAIASKFEPRPESRMPRRRLMTHPEQTNPISANKTSRTNPVRHSQVDNLRLLPALQLDDTANLVKGLTQAL